MPERVSDIAVSGDVVFVACGEAGLFRVDLTDVAQPKVELCFKTENEITAVEILGNYLVAGDGKLKILELANSSSPALVVGEFDPGIDARHFKPDGDRLLVFEKTKKQDEEWMPYEWGPAYSVVDVSNPVGPKLLVRHKRFDSLHPEESYNYDRYGFPHESATFLDGVLYAPIHWRDGFRGHYNAGDICLYDWETGHATGTIDPPYAANKIIARNDLIFASGVNGGVMVFRGE